MEKMVVSGKRGWTCRVCGGSGVDAIGRRVGNSKEARDRLLPRCEIPVRRLYRMWRIRVDMADKVGWTHTF